MTEKDIKRVEFLMNKQKKWCEEMPIAKKLIDKIEGYSDNSIVVAPGSETKDNVENLLEKGIIFGKEWKVEMNEMERNRCHQNSAKMWMEHIRKFCRDDKELNPSLLICTGYMKTYDDYVWRQHTWLVDVKNHDIYETTVEAEIYFGYILDEYECLQHCFFENEVDRNEYTNLWYPKLDNDFGNF